MSVIAFSGAIGPVRLDCILSEQHSSQLEITGNPIEIGAEVNDHAYIKPKQVTLEIANRNAAATYSALIRFQESRVPFQLVSGLTVYPDMLIQAIDVTRDKDMARILKARVTCRQIVIVNTATAQSASVRSISGQSVGVGGAIPAATSTALPIALPGGRHSLRAAPPSAELAVDALIADRVAGVVQRGDSPTLAVSIPQQLSLLRGLFH